MRGMATVLGLLCAWPAMAAPPPGRPANEGLQIGLSGWTVADGGGTCSVGIDREVTCGGKPAAVLRRVKAGAAGSGFLESGPLAVKPSQVYLLQCSVKGREIPPSGEALLAVRFGCSAGPGAVHDLKMAGECCVGAGPSSGPGPGGRLPAGTFDWQPFRLYVRACEAADAAVIRLAAPAAGTLWISGVRFTAVPVVSSVKYEIRGAIGIPGYGDAPEGYLTDGIFCWNQGANNEKIGRGYRGLEQGITISLALPRPTMVDRLVLSLVRVNCGHTLRKIEISCNKYGQCVKVAEGPGYLTEEFDQRLWIIEVPVRQRTDTVELKLFGDGYLVPYEILVVEGSQGRSEDMQKYALAGWLVLAASAAPAAQQPVVVENELVRMEFCPAEGGVCKRMLYKPAGKELGLRLFGRGLRAVSRLLLVAHRAKLRRRGLPARGDEDRRLGGHPSVGPGGGRHLQFHGGPQDRHADQRQPADPRRVRDQEHRGFHDRRRLRPLGTQFPGRDGREEPVLHPDHRGDPGGLQRSRPNGRGTRNCGSAIRPGAGWPASAKAGMGWPGAWITSISNLFYQFLGLALPTCEWQYNRITGALRPEPEDRGHAHAAAAAWSAWTASSAAWPARSFCPPGSLRATRRCRESSWSRPASGN